MPETLPAGRAAAEAVPRSDAAAPAAASAPAPGPTPPPSLAEWRTRLQAAGARPVHEAQFWRRWLQAKPLQVPHGGAAPNYPQAVAQSLPQWAAELDALAQPLSGHADARDGAERLLLQLADGQQVETVLLPSGRPDRPGGVCISTQVGCAVGCAFCMTGTFGLLRQLGSAEILAQVVAARRRRPLRRVLLMGMGEPAHNLDAVLEAITALATWGGIGHKEIVLSTVGDARVFEALPRQRVQPSLALSLHSTDAGRRAALLPRAPAFTPEALIEAGDAYARSSGAPIQVQWTLLDGVNDGDDEVQGLIALLRGRRAMLNLILYNANDPLPFRRPPIERAVEMTRQLNRAGILTRMRDSAGQAVDGGCGQLRARAAALRPQPMVLRRGAVALRAAAAAE